jgi:hypothetical protein
MPIIGDLLSPLSASQLAGFAYRGWSLIFGAILVIFFFTFVEK